MPRLGLGASLSGGVATGPNLNFESTWLTTSSTETITLPLTDDASFETIVVDWGDGSSDTITAYNDSEVAHEYSDGAGTKTIKIAGNLYGFQFNNAGDKAKIQSITNWGNFNLSVIKAFKGCANLNVTAGDVPTISTTTLFQTFYGCTDFNGDISGWDVSSIANFQGMFLNCVVFNQSIDNWTIKTSGSADITMFRMFSGCLVFDQDLNSWDISEVNNTAEMFYRADKFGEYNGAISNWKTGNVTNMNNMFRDSLLFNNAIPTVDDKWDVSNVENMSLMFSGCYDFNQDISSWDVSSVENMSYMFQHCYDFNQGLAGWDVSKVVTMSRMFKNALAFDQDLSEWDFDDVTSASTGFNEFMNGKTGGNVMSTANYNALLVQIEDTNEETDLVFDGGGAEPTGAGDTARAALITRGWTITDADT